MLDQIQNELERLGYFLVLKVESVEDRDSCEPDSIVKLNRYANGPFNGSYFQAQTLLEILKKWEENEGDESDDEVEQEVQELFKSKLDLDGPLMKAFVAWNQPRCDLLDLQDEIAAKEKEVQKAKDNLDKLKEANLDLT